VMDSREAAMVAAVECIKRGRYTLAMKELEHALSQQAENAEPVHQLKSKFGGWDDVTESEYRIAHPGYTRRKLYTALRHCWLGWKAWSEETPTEPGKYLTYWSDGTIETYPFDQYELEAHAVTIGTTVLTHWAELPQAPDAPVTDYGTKPEHPVIQAARGAWPEIQKEWAKSEHPDDPWISCAERLPEDWQSVAFVAKTNPAGCYPHGNGKVFGGIYRAGEFSGFTVPGMTMDAYFWMPLPAPPEEQEGE